MTSGLFFDWYGCSLDHNPDLIMTDLLVSYPHGTWEVVKPKNGYTDAMSLFLPDLSVAVTLWWGGSSQGSAVYAYASGSTAHTFASSNHSLLSSNVQTIMNDFSESINGLIGEVQLELSDITPPYSNTGATLSQNTPQTPKLRGV